LENAVVPDSRLARIAALCYLVVIAGGIFSALFVRDALFVAGDAGATARAVVSNEALWRTGIAVHLLYLLPGAAFNVILYRLFRSAGPTLALAALVMGLADIAIEGALLVFLYLPLFLLREVSVFAALDPTLRDALAYLSIRAFLKGWSFALVLFAGFCVGMGVLLRRSGRVPPVIGLLMVVAGLAYLASGLIGVLSPATLNLLLPWILVPSFVGEFSLAAYLAVRGVRQPV
jgi:hypothetical protein